MVQIIYQSQKPACLDQSVINEFKGVIPSFELFDTYILGGRVEKNTSGALESDSGLIHILKSYMPRQNAEFPAAIYPESYSELVNQIHAQGQFALGHLVFSYMENTATIYISPNFEKDVLEGNIGIFYDPKKHVSRNREGIDIELNFTQSNIEWPQYKHDYRCAFPIHVRTVGPNPQPIPEGARVFPDDFIVNKSNQ